MSYKTHTGGHVGGTPLEVHEAADPTSTISSSSSWMVFCNSWGFFNSCSNELCVRCALPSWSPTNRRGRPAWVLLKSRVPCSASSSEMCLSVLTKVTVMPAAAKCFANRRKGMAWPAVKEVTATTCGEEKDPMSLTRSLQITPLLVSCELIRNDGEGN